MLRTLCFAVVLANPAECADCCWSKWGSTDACGSYPGDGHGGLCNTNWSKSCNGATDCPVTPVPPPPPPPPTPTPGPTPTPTPTPGPSPALAALDIIGYYGNSGNAVSSIPLMKDISPLYNVIILTFASFNGAGNMTLDLQGPYEHDHAQLIVDLCSWKAQADAHGRLRRVLVSIGGQNGNWPSGMTTAKVLAGVRAFLSAYGLDGLDIDLEGGSVGAATSLVPVVRALVADGKTVTAAPEAAQGPLDAYTKSPLLKELSWVHPQFYNNGPNAVTTPYVPPAALWPTPWTVHDWQAESGGQSFWAGVLAAIGDAAGLQPQQLGMLVPATTAAAGSYNHWDADKLAQQVAAAGVTHVGTWAVAYDKTQEWKLAEALGKLLRK